MPYPLRYKPSFGNRAPLRHTRCRQTLEAPSDKGRQDHHQFRGNGNGKGNHRQTKLGVLEPVDTGQSIDLAAELFQGAILIRVHVFI